MKSFLLVFLALLVCPLYQTLAGPMDWSHGSNTASPIGAVLGRRWFVSETQDEPTSPQHDRLARRKIPYMKTVAKFEVAHIDARAGSDSSDDSPTANAGAQNDRLAGHGPKPTGHSEEKPKSDAGSFRSGSENNREKRPASMNIHNTTIAHNSTSADSTSITHMHSANGGRRLANAHLGTNDSTKTKATKTADAGSEHGSHPIAKANLVQHNAAHPSNATTGSKSRPTANSIASTTTDFKPASASSADQAQPTSDATATDYASDSAYSTETAAFPEDTSPTDDSQSEDGDGAPPYNLKNLSCSDYLGIHDSAEKWNATDGDTTMRDFIDMFDSDKLFCNECFGQIKSQCQSESKACSEGIKTRATPENSTKSSWSAAAAFYGQYSKADSFTCQIGPNECASAPDCKELNGGKGVGSMVILQSLSTAYLGFQSNYDAIKQAGDECDMQMQHFSDVFAPVPDSEGEAIALIVMTSIFGGLAGFFSGGIGMFAGIATGLGSGLGMEKFFQSRPTAPDTSSTLGTIVDEVLDSYGNMSDSLFQDGEYSHPSSDGKENLLTLQNFMSGGQLLKPDSDPKNHFRNSVPTYKKILFQQLALLTWQNLEVDGKTHTPFIAFDTGSCDKVDPKQKSSVASEWYLDGVQKLDVQVDFQGNCCYLLDAYTEANEGSAAGPQCSGTHALPGATNKKLAEEDKTFAQLSLADFVIPSVLGWQAHSHTNGYAAASANGDILKDPRQPGVVNIPVCDFVADRKHPGVACPLINQDAADTKKCQIVPASEDHNQPGQYQQGGCRAHVVQWQKNEVKNNANQLPDYQLSVDIFDQDNRPMGSATKQDAAKPLEVGDIALPYDLIVAPGVTDDDPVYFWYADQYWMSNETGDPHKCHGGGGQGGGGGYDNGLRHIDCGFDCPLKQPDDDPPASATIAYPLPGPPVMAVPGATSYVNTYSKTAPATTSATPDYASGVCSMKITQYQKHEKDSNPTNDYQLEINVKDSNGKEAANLPKVPCPSGKPVAMHGLKGGDFTVTVGKDLDGPLKDDSPLSFSYNGQDFDTKSLKCNIGGYQDGDREMNCNINC